MDPAIDLALRLALAVVLLVAALHKARDRERFRAVLADYRIAPAVVVPGLARLVMAAELLAAGLLVAPTPARPAASVGAAILFVAYGAAIGVNLVRGRRHIDCGCGGVAERQPIGPWMLARNAGLAATALATRATTTARPYEWVDTVTILGAAATLVLLYDATERLGANLPRATRLRGQA